MEKVITFFYILFIGIICTNTYLVRKRSNVIFDVEGSRFLIELRMIDGRLVGVPEELVDVLLVDQIRLISGAGGHLRGVSKAHRRKEQRNHFHPRCFAKDFDRLCSRIALYTNLPCKKSGGEKYGKFGT